MVYKLINTRVSGTSALRTGLIELNRPKQLNALNNALMDELGDALLSYDNNDFIGCIVITGNDRAFAAGADIASMAHLSYMDAYFSGLITKNWEIIKTVRKPVIAAVSGLALGGGCELAMMCDFIIAAETARFGQPEVKLGVIAGAGGTQRLPRAIGKSKAMDMLLTARLMNAVEAERAGLVSRVVSQERLMDEVFEAAQAICEMSLPSILMTKECVNRSFEAPLADGVRYERQSFHSLFATHDQKEGMSAFMEKRKPNFKNC